MEGPHPSQPLVVFWSWQADSDASTNRHFIEDCLKHAVKNVAKSEGVLIVVDRDTKGIGGSPGIFDTILRKIRSSDVFVFDATLVHGLLRHAPNPNVAVELGYALAAMGEGRTIGVMNTAGYPNGKALPFDLKHKRWPVEFALRPVALPIRPLARRVRLLRKGFHKRREAVRASLIRDLETALRDALKEPKSGALRADCDLLAANRLWSLLDSRHLDDWATYRNNYPQYEERSQLKRFDEYLQIAALPENAFENENLRETHDKVRDALARYRHVCALEMKVLGRDLEQLVITAKQNADREPVEDYKANDAHYERQVTAVENAVDAVWTAWVGYVTELRTRCPEVVDRGSVE